jgi:hypothetical protein
MNDVVARLQLEREVAAVVHASQLNVVSEHGGLEGSARHLARPIETQKAKLPWSKAPCLTFGAPSSRRPQSFV